MLQEVYVTVWRKAASFDPSRASPITWLVAIARNRAIDRLRSEGARARAQTLAGAEPAAPAADASGEAGQRTLADRMAGALAALERQHREVLELAYFGGLSQTEIATRLGAPLGTVKSWTRQALARLRERVPEGEWS